jgi:hypothetical protein
MAYTYSKIATYTVGSGGVASIDFLNIPQTYTDLVLKVSMRDSWSNPYRDLVIGFNGVTTNLSNRKLVTIDSSTPASYTGSNGNFVWENAATSTANTFANIEYYIPNYTNSNYKSISVDAVTENNSANNILALTAGLWSSTAPITSIKLSPNDSGTTFVQYSSAHLYGIKAEV